MSFKVLAGKPKTPVQFTGSRDGTSINYKISDTFDPETEFDVSISPILNPTLSPTSRDSYYGPAVWKTVSSPNFSITGVELNSYFAGIILPYSKFKSVVLIRVRATNSLGSSDWSTGIYSVVKDFGIVDSAFEAAAAAELKAKQEAEAKFAAELKEKQEAFEQKLMNEVIALIDEINNLGEKYPSQNSTLVKYSTYLSSWKDAPSWYRDYALMARESNRIRIEIRLLEVEWSKSKKTTITCVKGKLTKKVTAVKPKCPSGYKKK